MSNQEVTLLRRAGRLNEAMSIAEADLRREQSHWTYSALFWVLRDFCRLCIERNQVQSAREYIRRMELIIPNINDSQGYAQDALILLKRQLTPYVAEVQRLSENSKNGQEELAYTQICELNRNYTLSPLLHEDFGWIIYRYLRECYETCGSINARKALKTYLELQNKRPSKLHSSVLKIAIRISEKYNDFKFLPFLGYWDLTMFTSDDLQRVLTFAPSSNLEDDCLAEKCIEQCVKSKYSLEEINESFRVNSQISQDDIYYAYSRCYFFDINNCRDEDNTFFDRIDNYLKEIDGFHVSNDYHSKILTLYLRKLPENKSELAVLTINKWGLGNFRNEDWVRGEKEEKVFPSLIEKVIKRYFQGLKNNSFHNVDPEFEILLEKACEKYDNEQLKRNLAILLSAKGDEERALAIYKSLLLDLNKYYVWKELAEITDDLDLKISAYCKAIVSEPQDDFLGDIHLSLAKLMIDDGLFPEAKRELKTYADTYQRKGWHINENYNSLISQIPNDVPTAENNNPFYESHMSSAEDFVYSDIDWTTMFIADIYNSKKDGNKIVKKVKLISTDGVSASLKYNKLVGSNKELGKCYDVKIHSKEGRNEIVLIKESEIHINQLLPLVVCYVDYHNQEKKCYHLVSENKKGLLLSSAPENLKEGNFCICYEVPAEKNEKSKRMKAIFHSLIPDDEGIEKFPLETAVVDGVNEDKLLFHCVFGRNSGIIIKYKQTKLRPKIGDYVLIRYIQERNKDGRDIRKMLTIEMTDTIDKVLKKTITGKIRIDYNFDGEEFGFVEDYYVPTSLLEGINEGDLVCIDVVFNGERWRAYRLAKNDIT